MKYVTLSAKYAGLMTKFKARLEMEAMTLTLLTSLTFGGSLSTARLPWFDMGKFYAY